MQDAQNAWRYDIQCMKGSTTIERIRSRTKKAKTQPQEPFLIQPQRLFRMSVSLEVRQGLEEWELEMHIDKEVRVLTTLIRMQNVTFFSLNV